MKPTPNVPEIVPVVLTQLGRMFVAHEIPKELFEQKTRRLCVEELNPRGHMLLVREVAGGGIRFIIKDSATQSFLQMVEWPGFEESDGHNKFGGSASGRLEN